MIKFGMAALAFALATPALAAASLVTTDAGYTGRGLDLTAYTTGSYTFTFGPIPVDGMTFTVVSTTTNGGGGGVVGNGVYGLGSNGIFDPAASLAAANAPTGYAQLLGTVGYSQFGFFFNYAPGVGDSPTISSLDAAGNVIDSFDIGVLAPISTPGGLNQFAFRGIVYDDATLVYGLRFGGSYIIATGTEDGSLPAVPEPATWAMLITGFGLVGAAARRRRPSGVTA